ncbi:5-methylcytosine-specific restriction enzyme subunit McrC [Corynebacterium maris DSM 45190]|uniref:5-methylcytosine-specific restriction enzyme subunit McrC n=2 Tax=Corynebacterium TaxID=1716 RepID=S5TGS6_9CORY|nr:5-methylcytosine-specific restriction enzyme subunit McrC [Corynebacterium maris DSM 45190]
MITAAELMLDLSIPEPGAGADPVVAPKDEDGYLRTLFEKAVGGFYTKFFQPRGWTVQTGKWLSWNEAESTPRMSAILPKMQTDIILRPPSRPPIIVDTKFTRVIRANQYTQERLKSEYLYQMYAYVRSQEGNSEFGPATAGLLLHPVVDDDVREWTFIGMHAFGVATVDLAGKYSAIVAQLRAAVDVPDGPHR